MTRCTVCKRTLSAKNSVANNIGPVCAKKSFKLMIDRSGETESATFPGTPPPRA